MTDKPPDPAELDQLLAEGKWMFNQLASAMLNCPALVAGFNDDVQKRVASFKAGGCRIGLEIFAEESGATKVFVTAVSVDGHTRHPLADVSLASGGAPN